MREKHQLVATAALAALLVGCSLGGGRGQAPAEGSPGGGRGPAGPVGESPIAEGSPEASAAVPAAPEAMAATGPAGEPTAEPTATPEPTAAPATEAPPEPTSTPKPTNAPPEATPVVIDARGGGAESLAGAWEQAYDLPAGVPFRITVSEDEVEAMISQRMAESGYGGAISEIKVRLDDGQIRVRFTLTITQPRTISVEGEVVFTAEIDGDGNLALTVTSAEFGRISLPPEMLDALSAALAAAITGAASSAEAEVTLTELIIDDGLMTVSGTVR